MAISRGAEHARAQLKKRGKSQTWLAEQCGVHQTTISALFRGAWEPDVGLAKQIEEELGTPIAWWAESSRKSVQSTRKRRARSGEARP